jgi:hypothetical protein
VAEVRFGRLDDLIADAVVGGAARLGNDSISLMENNTAFMLDNQ